MVRQDIIFGTLIALVGLNHCKATWVLTNRCSYDVYAFNIALPDNEQQNAKPTEIFPAFIAPGMSLPMDGVSALGACTGEKLEEFVKFQEDALAKTAKRSIDMFLPTSDLDDIDVVFCGSKGRAGSRQAPLRKLEFQEQVATTTKTTKYEVTRDESRPICRMIEKEYPNMKCEEGVAEHNAMAFYKDNCGKATKNMYPGKDCQGMRHILKKLWPEIDQDRDIDTGTDADANTNEPRPLCEAIEKAWPATKCKESIAQLNARTFYKDDCGEATKNMYPGTDCQEMRRKFKELWPEIDQYRDASAEIDTDIDSDHDTDYHDFERASKRSFFTFPSMPSFLPNQNFRAPLFKEPLSPRDGHSNNDYGSHGGYNDYTERHSYHELDSRDGESDSEHEYWSVCLKIAQERLAKYWGLDATEEVVNDLFPDIDWSVEEQDCTASAILESRTFYHKLVNKHNKIEACYKYLCEPYIVGADCNSVKKELEAVSKDVGKQYDWTRKEEICWAYDKEYDQIAHDFKENASVHHATANASMGDKGVAISLV